MSGPAVDRIVAVKDDGLKRAITRLSVLPPYDALAQRNSLSVPQLLDSTMRSAVCADCPGAAGFDQLRNGLFECES